MSTSNAVPPPNWKKSAPGPPTGTITAAAQDTLPHLPVPDLSTTLAKLSRSLRPIAHSQQELETANEKIREFEDGFAKELQSRLLKRRDETEHWLEEWWDAWSYMAYRDSVVINVSYFYGFDAHPSQYPRGPVHRAAALTRAILLFRQSYRKGELKPEATKEGPICMDTYRWMFDCCRIPGLTGIDWAQSYAKEGDGGSTGHVIVLRKNRVWKINIAKDGKILSTGDLERQFQYIYDNTSKDYPGVGVLTASNRDVWANDYAELISDPHNNNIVREIHSSAFVVCLDDTTPTSIPSFSRQLWHGGSPGGKWLANRWVDKPVQLIVCDGEEAKAGIMGEHSVMDGTPTARMCDDVLDMIASPSFDHGISMGESIDEVPQALDWKINSTVTSAISVAKTAAAELVDSQTLNHFLVPYGKNAIKSFGVSPDSWAQLVVQLAYARLLRRTGLGEGQRQGATYEAASTRKFLKGRTEAIRVVSEESDRWVAAMLQGGENGEVDDDVKRKLFAEAVKRHVTVARECGSAQGVDRHLLGLKLLVRPDEELPALYSDPLYLRASRWVLSTSAIFSKHFDAYGWGEVVPDGFGVAYMTGFEDKLFFNITSRKEMPNDEFCEEIQRAAKDLYSLFSKKPRL